MHEQQLQKLKGLRHLLWTFRGVVVFAFSISAIGNALNANRNPIAIGIALTAPVICLVAIEFGSRVPIPGKDAGLLRIVGTAVRILATATIAIFMAVISYRHQRDTVMTWSDDQLQATLLPGSIDAFMAIGSVCVMEIQAQMRELEKKIQGVEVAKAREAKPTQEKALTGRERIAMALLDMPWASVKEIAAKAGTKENYTSTVVSELRKAQRNGNGTSAVTVAN